MAGGGIPIPHVELGFLGGSDGKESACNAEDLGPISGSGRSLGERNGNPLQYSCLENPMDRGACWATVHGATESDMTEQLAHTHTYTWDRPLGELHQDFSPVLPPRTLEGLHRSSPEEPKTHESMNLPPAQDRRHQEFLSWPIRSLPAIHQNYHSVFLPACGPRDSISAEQISAVILQSPISPDGRVTARLATSVL